MTPFILPFDSGQASLETVGGKGASLARLARTGHPVPGGFLVTTAAYRTFTQSNRLDEPILSILASAALNEMSSLEQASGAIHRLFEQGRLPPALAEELCASYRAMDAPPVAVRSSATAEDLPDLSFAGQQETFLNVQGEPALLQAVVRCWASLWTGRAIGYRARQGIAADGLALAVVVQHMVPSEASGVLFTANPLTGRRSEIVIDATLGLGEALVSGQVEPDHYVVDSARWVISEKTLGAKAIAIHSQVGGGTFSQSQDAAARQALPDEQILALARLGKQVEAEYGFPQDIEWGWAAGKMNLLQSRPVTSLFPLPEAPAEPAGLVKVYFSFGAVQGMLDPITRLGSDLMRMVFAMGSGLFGYHKTLENQTVLVSAGERLWGNITPILRNSVGRKAMYVALGWIEPSVRQAVESIANEPSFLPGRKGIGLGAMRHLLTGFPRIGFNAIRNLASPEARRKMIVAKGETILTQLKVKNAAVSGDRYQKLAQRSELIPYLAIKELLPTFTLFVSGVAAGMASFNFLDMLTDKLPAPAGTTTYWHDRVLEITRGMPYNPTTEMDLALWASAQAIRRDPNSARAFGEQSAAELSAQYQAGRLPPAAQQVVQQFLATYGGRGLAEIDMGRPRWSEDPTHVMQVLGSYLQITDESRAPDAVFKRGAQSAAAAVEELAAAVRKTRGGWLKERLVRGLAWRVRALMGMRESPKFFAVRMFANWRNALLESGAEFVQSGELDAADDLVHLGYAELRALAAGQPGDWKALVAQHRAAYGRELKRRQVPRLLLSDGRAFYEGMVSAEAGANSITGSPVSPGLVEGAVRVILDPRGAQILPGEILVCPGTDPSWTPLFLAAGGLVMEVGGMMTHGAVVAREYGIPAAVGVHQATTRLVTGQRIRLDGSSGMITLL